MTNDATEEDVTKRLTKAFSEALAAPPATLAVLHPEHLSEAIDHMDWLEKGNEEWRQMYVKEVNKSLATKATARVAIHHLNQLVQNPMDLTTQLMARDWLLSIGGEV